MARATCPNHGIALTPGGCLLCTREERAAYRAHRGWLALGLAGLVAGLGALVHADAQPVQLLRRTSLQLPSPTLVVATRSDIAEAPGGSYGVVPTPRFSMPRGEGATGEGEVVALPEPQVTEETHVVAGGRRITEHVPKPVIRVVYVRPGPVRVVERARPLFFHVAGARQPSRPGFEPRYRRGDDGKFKPRSAITPLNRRARGRGIGVPRRPPLRRPRVGAPR